LNEPWPFIERVAGCGRSFHQNSINWGGKETEATFLHAQFRSYETVDAEYHSGPFVA
jgi:hypothetical protein